MQPDQVGSGPGTRLHAGLVACASVLFAFPLDRTQLIVAPHFDISRL